MVFQNKRSRNYWAFLRFRMKLSYNIYLYNIFENMLLLCQVHKTFFEIITNFLHIFTMEYFATKKSMTHKLLSCSLWDLTVTWKRSFHDVEEFLVFKHSSNKKTRMNIVYVCAYKCIPEKGAAKIHTKLLTAVILVWGKFRVTFSLLLFFFFFLLRNVFIV